MHESPVNPAPATWLLPALDGVPLSLDWEVDTGMGIGFVLKDGERIYASNEGAPRVCAEFEALAAMDPDHDWRILFLDSTCELHFQRHGSNCWMLIEKNGGSFEAANALSAQM